MQSQRAGQVHILVVDDDAGVRDALKRSLQGEGYGVSLAGGKAEALERLAQQPPIDLITLDLRLDHEDGLCLAREIRAQRNIPIIMITALSEPLDRVTGLENGADDYIIKPFHTREVLMRIKSVLLRYELNSRAESAATTPSSTEEIYLCDAGVTDIGRRRLTTHSGAEISLTDAEFDILVIFLRNPARILSRDDLSLSLRGRPWSPTDRSLDGHIARLRKKIEPDIEHPVLIKTVWGVGYVFAGEVQPSGAPSSPRSAP